MNLNRLEALIGSEKLNKVRNLNILLVGVGGVGGYTFESLVRSGVNNITIVDYDKIDPTNLNRQIITNSSNIGLLKTEEAKKRALLINENINIITKNIFLVIIFIFSFIRSARFFASSVFNKPILEELVIICLFKLVGSILS